MVLGSSSKFNILRQSPHDFQPAEAEPAASSSPRMEWVPSRYTVRAVTEDGRLVLWNTHSGSMNTIPAYQRSTVETLLSKKGFEARSEGIVEYLFNRGFLLKKGTDEFRRIRLDFGQQQYRTDVLELNLLASEDCNFRCIYCYEKFARGTMAPAVRTGVKNLVSKRIKRLDRLSIDWFGGEPLYGFEAIEDIAPFCLEMAQAHSVRYTGSMTTNGYLLTPEVADKLLSWEIKNYQITLDGTGENHDHNRPTRDGQGTFSTILNNLRALRQREDDYLVDIRVNWDKNNYSHLDRFLDFFDEEFSGDSRFQVRFRPIFEPGAANSNADKLDLCGLDEGRKLQEELLAEARKRGFDISDNILHVKPFGSRLCYAARPYHFLIGAQGDVMKCTIELNTVDRNIVGQLSEDGELDLDQDKMALWCEPAFESDTKCQKCVVLPICLGSSCPLIRFETNSSPCIELRQNVKNEIKAAAGAASCTCARKVAVGAYANQDGQGYAAAVPPS